MTQVKSDALVFYGATGDLAYKKIFPALHMMVKRGNLNSPIIGVARGDYDLEKLRARAKESIQKHGSYDEESYKKFCSLLAFVGGDYTDQETFRRIREALGGANNPTHYLAIPPVLFPTIIAQLDQSGCAKGARIIVEKPFGTDYESARALNKVLLANLPKALSTGSTTTWANVPSIISSSSALSIHCSSQCGTISTLKASRLPWRRILVSKDVEHSMT
jgi:glucose-6-phosphate 1-dehydrogenase